MIKLFIPLFLILFASFSSPTFALESTKSATTSADLRQKLKLLQEEIASKAAQLKQEVSKKLQNKVYLGFIKSKSENSLSIATDQDVKIINLNEFTEYEGSIKGKIPSTLKNLSPEDYIIALGDVDENEVLTAKKVIRTELPKAKKEFISGNILSATNKLLTIKVNNQILTFSVDKNTVYQEGNSSALWSDLKEGESVIIIGEVNKSMDGQDKSSTNSNPRARFIFIYPKKKPILKTKISSPTASLTSKLTPTAVQPTPKK